MPRRRAVTLSSGLILEIEFNAALPRAVTGICVTNPTPEPHWAEAVYADGRVFSHTFQPGAEVTRAVPAGLTIGVVDGESMIVGLARLSTR